MTNKENLIYPTGPIVEVGTNVDWVYIMRKDAQFSMTPLATKLAQDIGLNPEVTKQAFLRSYDTFCNGLFHELLHAYKPLGKTVLHLYEAEELEYQTKKIVADSIAVSLDPLLNINSFKVSRGFFLGGKVDHGQVNRPGSEALGIQAKALALLLGQNSIKVIEDDIFSGGSLMAALDNLLKVGFGIQAVVPGIQVGEPSKVQALGIPVAPVIKYQAARGTDIFAKVDLGDPRDFLLGASGLVVKLESGSYGRLPYVLPFASTSARAQVPQATERSFSQSALQLSADFYASVQAKLGVPVQLGYTDEHFAKAMHELFGLIPATSMVDVANWARQNLDEIWHLIQDKGGKQQ